MLLRPVLAHRTRDIPAQPRLLGTISVQNLWENLAVARVAKIHCSNNGFGVYTRVAIGDDYGLQAQRKRRQGAGQVSTNQRQTDFLAKVGDMWRSTVARAFAKTASPRQAIKAKCLDCCNFDKNEVTHCQTILCPLHEYRPYAKTVSSERRKNAFVAPSAPAMCHPSETTTVGNG